MSSTQAGFFDSLVAAIRENPLAAALIGGGAFWLLAGDEKLKSAARSATAAASPIVDVGARNVREPPFGLRQTAAPPTAPEMDHDESMGFGKTVREAGSAASDAMSGAADKIKDRFDEGVAYARENLGNSGKDALTKAQSSLADMLDRQPLVLGAVGLAIGAAIAGAFRTSDLENEWVGERSDIEALPANGLEPQGRGAGRSPRILSVFPGAIINAPAILVVVTERSSRPLAPVPWRRVVHIAETFLSDSRRAFGHALRLWSVGAFSFPRRKH